MGLTDKISGLFKKKKEDDLSQSETWQTNAREDTQDSSPNNQDAPTTKIKPEDIKIIVQSTPNPRAFKFIVNHTVKNSGKITYKSADECFENPFARDLLQVPGVIQIHFFDNVITATISSDAALQNTIDTLKEHITQGMPHHNPDFKEKESDEDRRKSLPPELQKIESILDKTIRPGLQMDGGDLEVLALEDNKLMIRYQGACGSCPSSVTGTLAAIEHIVREHYNPEIEVIAL